MAVDLFAGFDNSMAGLMISLKIIDTANAQCLSVYTRTRVSEKSFRSAIKPGTNAGDYTDANEFK